MIRRLLNDPLIFAIVSAIAGAIIWELLRYCKHLIWNKRVIRNEMIAVLDEANKQADQQHYDVAIKEYDKLLENIKKKDFPDLYSFAQRGKGICYLALARKLKQEQEFNLAIHYVKDAIEEFKSTQRVLNNGQFIDEFKYPAEIIKTYFTLGSAYEGLSDIRKKEGNLFEAISYYQKALEICGLYETNEALFEMYYKSFNNIGICYGKLAQIKERKANLEKAIEYFDKALKICKNIKDADSYSQVLIQKGNCYLMLSRAISKSESINKSIEIYSEAVEIIKTRMDLEKVTNPNYASAQIGLGNSYQYLANFAFQDIQDCIERSIKHFDEALKYTSSKELNKISEIKNNKALAYKSLAKALEPKKNLNEAKILFEDLLKTYNIADYPYQHAQTLANLAIVYGELSEYQEQNDLKQNLIRKSIEYFKEVIKTIYNKEKFPDRYLDNCNNLATAYINLASITGKNGDIMESINYSEEVTHATNHSTFQYTKALLNLGIGYSILYQNEKDETKKIQAENYFKEAMMLLKDEKDEIYYEAENNLKKLKQLL